MKRWENPYGQTHNQKNGVFWGPRMKTVVFHSKRNSSPPKKKFVCPSDVLTWTHLLNKRKVTSQVAFVKIGHPLRFALHPGHQGLDRRSEGLPVHPQLPQVGSGMAGECLSILKIKSAQITRGIKACGRVENKRYDTGFNVLGVQSSKYIKHVPFVVLSVAVLSFVT